MSHASILRTSLVWFVLSAVAIGTGVWISSTGLMIAGAVGAVVALAISPLIFRMPKYVGFLVIGTSRELLWQAEVWSEVVSVLRPVIESSNEGASIVFFPAGKNRSSEWKWSDRNLDKFLSQLRIGDEQYYHHFVYLPPRKSLIAKQGRSEPLFYMRVQKGLLDNPESVSRCTQHCTIFAEASFYQERHHEIDALVAFLVRMIDSPLVGRCFARFDLGDIESIKSGISYFGVHRSELPDLSRMDINWHEIALSELSTGQ